jgi:hypothetical protein
MEVDTAFLRERLHAAVDHIIDELATEQTVAAPAAQDGSEPVEAIGPLEPFTFAWPANYGSEDFSAATAFRLSTLVGEAAVIIGWTTRHAWNADRRRAVVFHRARPEDAPTKWYPWTEFVETDTGRFAASIPSPQRPRAILRDGDPLPSRFSGQTVARSDEVFGSIREGASLRLVVHAGDEASMVRHGYWVAKLRGRV